jgi:ABC-type phosphate transport system substrate-binding protein
MSSKTQDVPDMQIIVNSKSSNKILMTREYIWAIFTFTIVNWENGQKIIVFAYPQNSSMLHDFVSEYFGMNTYMFQELIDEKTSASGRRPFIVSTEQQMILNVKSTPGSIGIIRSDTDTSAFNGIKRIILLD